VALNQYDRLTLLNSSVMQSRFTSACIQYANYLVGGSPTAGQRTWAKGCLDNPADMGRKVSPYAVNYPAFIGSGTDPITGDTWTGGSSIPEATLQGIVETIVNTHFIVA
jgi:hypothetical protein